MSEAARTRRPDLRFEPQMDRAGTGPAADPLAELARLVGQDDPFRDMFRPPAPRTDRVASRGEADARPASQATPDPRLRGTIEDGQAEWLPSAAEEPDGAMGGGEDHGWDEAEQPSEYDPHDYESQSFEGDGAHHGYHVEADPAGEDAARHDYQAPPLTPDLWAEGAGRGEAEADRMPLADESAPQHRAPRRPLAVLAAVLLLTGGGLAATFVARSAPGAAVLGRDTPTIMAAAGPNKIKQDDTTTATPEDVDSALLNRNNPASSGPARVVSSQEQPVDLGQLPKVSGSGDAPGDAPPSGLASQFPEPKKVKTFVVRPDGTIVSSGSPASAPAASPAADSLPAMAALPPAAELPVVAARASTPKSPSRAATTPHSPPTTIADAVAGGDTPDGSPANKARQASSAGVKSPRAKPVEVADASASITPAATGQGGAYGLQLAAAPTEQEARDLFAKLQKKYSAELGPYRPTIRKADSGDKSVYRLRVSNLSQDQAKQICSQLQASGGSCFVVRN